MPRRRRWIVIWATLAAALGVGGVAANPLVRTADHPGFGRMVFEFDGQTGFAVTRDGNHVVVRFDRPDLVPGAAVPRNVVAYHGEAGLADLQVVPGARVETMRIGNRVVIDVRDPQEVARPLPSVQPVRAPMGRPTRVPPASATTGAVASVVAVPAKEREPREQVLQLPVPGRSNAAALAKAVERALAAPIEPVRSEALPASPADIGPAGVHVVSPAPAATSATAALMSPALAVSAAALQPNPADPTGPFAPTRVTAESAMQVAAQAVPPDATGAVGLLLPFSRGTGAAVFRRGEDILVVFDERRPIDLASLEGEAARLPITVQVLPDATLLTLRMATAQTVRLERQAEGLVVRVVPSGTARSPLAPPVVPAAIDGQMRFVIANAGRSVVVPDRMTGSNLLVGTQRLDAAPAVVGAAPSGARFAAQGVLLARRSPGFVLLATEQGIAVEPLSDRVSLRAAPDGFRLEADAADLLPDAVAPDMAALMDGAPLTRRFDFPDRPVADLSRRMEALVEDAAVAPPRARLAPRIAAAQAMLALGLGPEAQAVLQVAAADDPEAADAPDLAALSAIGGLLVGRADGANALADPRLDGSDDIALWRAVAATFQADGAAAAAPVFAVTMPLVLAYPAPLRARLLPLVAETLVQGGETRAAERLIAASPDDPDLALARGLLAEAKGDVEAALAQYDSLALGHDRLVAARAGDQAIALRLRTGRLNAGQAADAMEKGLFNWREAPRELAQRRKIAELRAQAHAWRPALAMLRETAQLFPEAADALHAELHELFAAMLQDQPAVGALDLVMIADENADLMQQGEAGAKAAMLLVDRLTTLDLPDRAIPLLDRLMRGAADAKLRGQLGLRLAAMRLGQSDANGALAALAASDAPDLPPGVKDPRVLLTARALAAKGDLAPAIAQLSSVDSNEASLLRADLLSQAKDWPGAEAALQEAVARLPRSAEVLAPPDQDVMLRLASAAAQAGDEPELKRLQEQAPRLDGHCADLFRMLTAPPVAGVADLPRAARETAAARAVPGQIQTLAASAR